MADSYPERRFMPMGLEAGEITTWPTDDGIFDLRSVAEQYAEAQGPQVVTGELVSVADMDALRALVAATRPFAEGRVAGQHPILDALCDAFDAIPPACLATVEKT